MKKKVLFLTNSITPYRRMFFREMTKAVDLTVLYEVEHSKERLWSFQEVQETGLQEIVLKSWARSVNDGFCPGVIRYLKKPYDYIIVGGYSTPTGMLSILWLKLHGKRFILNADGGQVSAESRLKASIKRFFISSADGWMAPGAQTTAYLLHYGAQQEKIYPFPFTSLYERDIFSAVTTAEEKRDIRHRIGVAERYMIISVGRFSYLNGYGKGYDVLIRAAQRLPEDIGWYIVGGAPTEEFAHMVENAGRKNIHFVEFMDKEALKKYYRAADVFTLMTVGDVWGLVINEAMACGLPVITTDKCVAGLELVTDGENGYIVKVGDDEALAARVKSILETPGTAEAMGSKSLAVIRDYTIENMARCHMEAFGKFHREK